MNLSNILTLLQKEVRDSQRNRWFILLSVIFVGLILALSLLGLSGLGALGVAGFGRTTISLINLIVLIVPMMGLLIGAVSIASEREQGTLLTLLAQPITSSEIFLGKFLGIALAMCSSLILGFALSGLVIAYYGGLSEVGHFLSLLGFSLVLGLMMLGLGFCLSVLTHRHTTAVGMAIFCWFLFLFISDLGVMASGVVLELTPSQLLWISLINPIQVFKLAVISTAEGNLEVLGGAGRYAEDLFGDWFAIILLSIMLVWFLIPFIFSLFYFKKKCIQ